MLEKKLEVDKAYSYEELTKEYNLTLFRFNRGFSFFIDLDCKIIQYFKHYKPPEDKPFNRFYYVSSKELR
jgi:hypothetical protein